MSEAIQFWIAYHVVDLVGMAIGGAILLLIALAGIISDKLEKRKRKKQG